jgi:hypothetical protein
VLKVIGAGYPRTGTTSLKAALNRLGYGPCHHMEELFAHPEQIPRWRAVAERGARDWDSLLAGYASAVDFPAQHWYLELLAHNPGAKVILTVRDPEGWYRSMRATIWPISQSFPVNWVGRFLPVAGGVVRLATRCLWREEFEGRFLEPAYAIQAFQRHVERVKAAVPAEDLLIYDVREGWAPLCRFLGVPAPDEPFPRLNDTADFAKRVRLTQAMSWVFLLAPIVAAAGLLAALR